MILLQALYYMATGLWPIVHAASFFRVTGPKTDLWLVQMVGLLAFCIGLSIYSARHRHKITFDTFLLGSLSALAFLGIDAWYFYKGILTRVYAVDAALELFFILGWVFWSWETWQNQRD